MGWFFGCKLHVLMNQSGEMFSTALSNGHTADIKMVEQLVKGITAKLYADRGYISQELKSTLRVQGTDLITYHRKNMKSIQLSKADEHHLKQRNKIETLFSLLNPANTELREMDIISAKLRLEGSFVPPDRRPSRIASRKTQYKPSFMGCPLGKIKCGK